MYALPFFSYSYKNTWGMPIYQITIRNAHHNNVEAYSFYKNPQTIIQTLPDSVIETLFRLVSTAFPTLTFCNIARSPQLLKWGMNCQCH